MQLTYLATRNETARSGSDASSRIQPTDPGPHLTVASEQPIETLAPMGGLRLTIYVLDLAA
jgi:hypothetical protein